MIFQTRFKTLLCALVLLFALPASAKDLYLTVRRDFSPNEPAQIEVNYVSNDPITFRVLKPKDLKGFIASQIDLRRAWKEPKVEVNTANPFLNGLNQMSFAVDWIRRAADFKLRKGLQEKFSGGHWSANSSNFRTGPKKFISSPDAFDVVKEFSLAPKDEDAKKPFDVPGFEQWNGSSLATRMIELPKLEPGFYVVQTVQNLLEGQVVVVINDIQASLQQTDGAALVRVTDRAGQAAEGAKVSLRDLNGKWVSEESTSRDGVAEFKNVKSNELVAVVEGKGTAIIDTEFFSTTAVSEDLYLYSDRPMYKPSDEVSFRGILREPRDGTSRLLGKKKVRVVLVSADGLQIADEQVLKTTDFGTFSGTFKPKQSDTGLYRIQASVDDESHIGEFRIKDYVKPVFFAKIKSDQETLRPGQTLRAKLKVERYAGGAPSGAKFRAELYRSRLETPKWIDDAGLSETGSKVTYFFDQSDQPDISIPELLTSKDEEPVSKNGDATINLTVPSDIKGDDRYDYTFLLKVTVVDGDGNSATASQSFLDMKAEILAQTQISASFASPDFPATLKARAIYPSGKSYGKTKGTLEWFALSYKGAEESLGKMPIETDADGRFETKVPSQKTGQLRAVASFEDRNGTQAVSESSIVILPPKLGEGVIDVSDLTLMIRKNNYVPGETARALVLLPEGWGAQKTNKGLLYLTVAGSKIYAQRSIPVDGLSTFIEQKIEGEYGTSVYLVVSYSDPERGWVERTLPLTIPPLEKILNVALKPSSDVVLPGSEQKVALKVVDNSGHPVSSELSVAVVDRAVLDLQPEIRPSLLEFFYPPARLNLMSFFSTQFQSYGYGETIARLFKANHWFAATKPRADQLVEKDTAFWTGAVVTNDKGEAEVRFRLPANQTIWQVAAVAADKAGRFGEATAEFKANSPVQTILAMPSFLRLGDKGQIRLTLQNQDKQKNHAVKYELNLPPSANLDQPLAIARELKPGEEVRDSRQMQISKLEQDGGFLKFDEKVELEGEKLAFTKEIKTLSDRTPTLEIVNLAQAQTQVELKEDEGVRSANVTVTSGLMGAVVPSLQWLVHYPYGCIEQVTNQTIPNLLASDIFDESTRSYEAKLQSSSTIGKVLLWTGYTVRQAFDWAMSVVLGPTNERKMTVRYRKMLDDAKTYGDAGLTKIAAYQNGDGAYAWFENEDAGSANMTMFVLLNVLSTDNPEWARKVDAPKAFGYLTNQGYESGSPQKIMLAYLSGRLRALKLVENTSESYEPNLRQQLDAAIASGVPLQEAYMLLAIKDHNIPLEADMKGLVEKLSATLASQLKSALEQNDLESGVWRKVSEKWPYYIGHTASSVAVVSHALHEFGKLDGDLRTSTVRYLMKTFNGGNFGSTFETGQVLTHTAWLLREELHTRDRGRDIKIAINGKNLGTHDFDLIADLTGWSVQVKPETFSKGQNKIEVQNSNEFMSASLRLVRDVPMARAQASALGWDLQKTYYKVNEKTAKMTKLDPKDVKVGDVLYVKIDLQRKTDPKWWQSSYITLKDDIPAGFSVIEEDKDMIGKLGIGVDRNATTHSVRKVRADSIQWYYEFERGWMESGNQVGYFLRADFAGDFVTGVARVEDFYDEQAFAQTQASRIAVSPYQP